MSTWLAIGSPNTDLSPTEIEQQLVSTLDKLGLRKKVLAVPPDFSRLHSQAGILTEIVYRYYGEALTDVLPALGTHRAMTDPEIRTMFGEVPRQLFRVHDWRRDVVTLGEVPDSFIHEVSEGKLDFSWPAQVNKLVRDGGHDLILSIGQVVPHEVIGMANYNKNLLIGTGGAAGIHRSHFLGATYGMERIMGRADTPVRAVLNYASEHFLRGMPVVYVLTVVGKTVDGRLAVRGLYIGDGIDCFHQASDLALKVNFVMLDRHIDKAVVYLDPHEFKSTWLGNKSIYRTRMALADDAELIVLAPGVHEFGEDPMIDELIRRHGYCGTPETLAAVKQDPELASNLSAAAHLIHGSSEGRFQITYCPGHLSKQEIESVHFGYADLQQTQAKYDPRRLQDGWNTVDGEQIFYISNPGLGLWAYRERFAATERDTEIDRMSLRAFPKLFVVMGVSGSGKTTIGNLLAKRIGAEFVDADDFHPQANKDKMHAGIPLTDEDRWPWLATLNGILQSHSTADTGCVLACSALKAVYRDVLLENIPESHLDFILLQGSKQMIADRLAQRRHTFMNSSLLDSQFATLEAPEDAVRVVNDRSPEEVVNEILERESSN